MSKKIDVGMLNIDLCVFLKRCPVKAKYRRETTCHGTLFQDKAQISMGVLALTKVDPTGKQ
jgi:hypothetical protein